MIEIPPNLKNNQNGPLFVCLDPFKIDCLNLVNKPSSYLGSL